MQYITTCRFFYKNIAKNFQLGWYSDRTTSLTKGNINWEGNLKGLADYGDNSVSGEVIIHILDGSESNCYVSFNRQDGINSGTVEAGNQVLVHSKVSICFLSVLAFATTDPLTPMIYFLYIFLSAI